MIKYCRHCVYPETKPDLSLDKNQICDACRFIDVKDTTDWELRKKQLIEILEKFKNKDGSNYDCIIPVSGGKDSTFQAYIIKKEFGLNPLCVSYHLPEFTDLGRQNLENLKNLGVDCLEFTPNPEICRKMQKTALIEFGDAQWPEHFGIFTVPVQVAVKYNVPLIIWGENPQSDYGGPLKDMENQYLDRKWCENYGTRVGGKSQSFIGPEIMLKHGIERKFLNPYIYPSDEEINNVGVTGIFLGQFIRWNIQEQLKKVQELGFKVHDGPTEGTFTNYENLDNKIQGIHDYFKWIKFGYGRCSDSASVQIRLKQINREEGLKLVKQHEGKLPEKFLNEFLKQWNMSRDEFLCIVDKFTNKELFKQDDNGNLIRDKYGNIEKINYDNII
jgi:N-acetyl sugar amidotransferase